MEDGLMKPDAEFRFRRVLLKISGEALMGASSFGIDMAACNRMAVEISESLFFFKSLTCF